MADLLKSIKKVLKNKQVKDLHFFVPKKTKFIAIKTDGKTKYCRVKTGLTSAQLKIVKKFKHCYFTKEISHKKAEQKKAKNRKLLNISTFAINIVVLAIVLICSFVGQEDKSQVLFPPIDWRWIGGLAGIVALIYIVETTKYFILIKKSTKKSRPYLSYKVMVLGKYYDSVTPMSTGGQPFQMMYLNKRGIKGDVATSIPLVKYMFWQITYVIICSVILIYNQFFSANPTQIFSTVLAWIAVLANLLILLTVLFLSVSKKVGPLVVIWILKLGSKLHIVKNYRVTFRKVMRFVVNYQKTMKMFAKNIFVLITELLLAAADTLLFNIIPYFIYKAFVPTGTLSVVDMMVTSIICNLTIGFIPTPGASGGAEALFSAIFCEIFNKNYFWPMLIWRISTYYINLLQGLLVLVYDFLIGNKKAERLRLKEMGIEPTEPTFRKTLAENREAIKIIENQEEDKLVVSTFLSSKLPDESSNEEIIKGGDIVSHEEMQKVVYPAEQVLTSVRLREIKKQKQKRVKKETKMQNIINKKNKKKNK